MSIRKRLMLSNIAMIVIPVILFVIAAFLLVVIFKGDIQNIRGHFNRGNQTTTQESRMYMDIVKGTALTPGKFRDQQYLKTLNKKLQKKDMELVVRKAGKVLFVADNLDGNVTSMLPAFGENEGYKPVVWLDKQQLSIYQHNFYFTDGSEGTAFLIKDAAPFTSFARSFFPLLFVSLLMILALTNFLLTYFMSRSILRPVKRLSEAAHYISEGHLDFHVEKTSNDELGKLCETFDDMRERLKRSTELRQQYETDRKELIASISHDLKTPITSIKGYVEGIQDGVANSPEKVEKYLHTIFAKANDMDHLIDELFIYSKLDLKNLPFHFEKVDVLEYMKDYTEERQFEWDKEGGSVTLNAAKGDYLAIVDREKLKRVLDNIINNSIKYIDKKEKRIKINLTTAEDKVGVEIHDNGPGVTHQELPYIFDRFYRTDPSRNLSGGGSGLGLAIAKQIIEEHGGDIWAESPSNQGLITTFTLPKAEK
ncbi:histidine kinase [Scopulibacillus darangshiensis]|uniref:histidine kinase n=1 Tax=Scopulibacillus darangshiensis TaxID=442528 RepID=A0A4R2P5J8_9BACL|nr:HAMP domain-containing sensor histidine kinase [Scopulibacillus darangshiensis]TCP29967.1 histidine kinase [Scopulibacillus darangshiensis]